ncbi:acetate kinase [bacterium]|nr:acetate kinase [candidate division CSSED10-310 bacterium]
MKILIINCGSSSVKFQVFDMKDESVLCKGIAEKIGTTLAVLKVKTNKIKDYKETREMLDHHSAIAQILKIIVDPDFDVLTTIEEIRAVGHRVVHGGEYFSGSKLITGKVMQALQECIELAPLHNPPNIMGIKACQELLPGVPQVGVFDTAFHQTMKPDVFLYGLPYVIYQRHKIRRYGFHGTSHKYAASEAAKYLKQPLKDLKIITCHLGNGASITAIKDGKSMDTTMGFTPLEGLIMGTRCGDLDPAIIPYLIEKEALTLEGINNLMNKHSGVFGIAQMGSCDMRDLEIAEENGHEFATLARNMYAYRVKKYIGAYAAALGGIDVIVFTGGIGENDFNIRFRCVEDLEYLGVKVDKQINDANKEKLISTGPVAVLVIKADEELVIARETDAIIKQLKK